MASTTHRAAAPSEGSRARSHVSPGVVGRAAPALVAGGSVCALIAYLAWQAGGYFPDGYVNAGAVAFGALAVVLAVRPPYWRISTPAFVAVAALAGLAVWTAMSSYWSSAPDTALEDFQRTLLYLGLFGLGLLASGSGRYSRDVIWAMLTVALVIVGAGLISRLFPETLSSAATESQFNEYRLAYPLSYWNAFGALGAMLLVLATGLAGDPGTPPVLRGVAAAVGVIAGVGAYLSFSRGAWLAFFAGVLVLVVVSGHRRQLLASLAMVLLPLAVAIARLGSFPALTEDPENVARQAAAGDAYAPTLVLMALVAGGAQLAFALLGGRRGVAELADRYTRRGLYVLAGVLVLGGIATYAVRASTVEGGSARMLTEAEDFVDREWDAFMRPTESAPPEERTGSARLTTARGTRSDLWGIAIDGFQANPLLGDGSGGFEYRFAHDREVNEKVRDAHSLYLETAGELGIVGLGLLLAFLGAIVVALVRTRSRSDPLTRSQTAAVSAAVAVWAVHAALDWDWQVPGMTAVALVLATTAFPQGRKKRRRRRTGSGQMRVLR